MKFVRIFSGRFGTSRSMIACLVTEISPLDAFCDVVGVGVVVVVGVIGIGDSRSWIKLLISSHQVHSPADQRCLLAGSSPFPRVKRSPYLHSSHSRCGCTRFNPQFIGWKRAGVDIG